LNWNDDVRAITDKGGIRDRTYISSSVRPSLKNGVLLESNCVAQQPANRIGTLKAGASKDLVAAGAARW